MNVVRDFHLIVVKKENRVLSIAKDFVLIVVNLKSVVSVARDFHLIVVM